MKVFRAGELGITQFEDGVYAEDVLLNPHEIRNRKDGLGASNRRLVVVWCVEAGGSLDGRGRELLGRRGLSRARFGFMILDDHKRYHEHSNISTLSNRRM